MESLHTTSPTLQTRGLGECIPAEAACSHCQKSEDPTLTLPHCQLNLGRHVRNAWEVACMEGFVLPPLLPIAAKHPLNVVLNDRLPLPFFRKCFAMPISIP